jgi:hypothetical protein
MNRSTALLAFAFLLASASLAQANMAYRFYEDDPSRTQSMVKRTVVGLALGGMLVTSFLWFAVSKRGGKILAGTLLAIIVVVLGCGAIGTGGETLYLKGNRPPGVEDLGLWKRHPDGSVPQEQAIYPMTCGFLLSIGIAVGGLVILRWRRTTSISDTPAGFGVSRSSPDGTTD